MSFLTGLKAFGKDIVKVLAWPASPTGQKVVGVVEGVVETAFPASMPIVALFNSWAQKAYTIEAVAVAASQTSGTGAQRAGAVMNAVVTDVLSYAAQEGVSPRTVAQIQAANDAVVAFINAMTKTDPASQVVGATTAPPAA